MKRVQPKNRGRSWRLLIAGRRTRALEHEERPPPRMSAAERRIIAAARKRMRALFLELTDELIELARFRAGR